MKFDVSYFLSSKNSKWIIVALFFLFLVLIISEYASLFVPALQVADSSVLERNVREPAKKNSFDALWSSSLFGVYVSNDLNGDNIKKSMIDVTLVGILLGNTMADSQVIIRSADGEERNYKVDDKIPGEVVIKRIMAGGILVEREGHLERLSLPKNDLTFEAVAKPLADE